MSTGSPLLALDIFTLMGDDARQVKILKLDSAYRKTPLFQQCGVCAHPFERDVSCTDFLSELFLDLRRIISPPHPLRLFNPLSP